MCAIDEIAAVVGVFCAHANAEHRGNCHSVDVFIVYNSFVIALCYWVLRRASDQTQLLFSVCKDTNFFPSVQGERDFFPLSLLEKNL